MPGKNGFLKTALIVLLLSVSISPVGAKENLVANGEQSSLAVVRRNGDYLAEWNENYGGGHKGRERVVIVTDAEAQGSDGISLEQAMAVALEKTGGGTVVKSEVDRKKHGRIEYEFKIINNGVKYEVEVDSSGVIRDFERKTGSYYYQIPQQNEGVSSSVGQDGSGKSVSPEKAIGFASLQALALDAVGGGTIVRYQLENESGENRHRFIVNKDDKQHALDMKDDGVVTGLSVTDSEK